MIRARNLKALLKDVGPQAYKAKLREMLGIEIKNNPEGTFPAKFNAAKAQISTDEFSIRDLTEEFLGTDFVSGMHNPKTGDHYAEALREALNPVTASVFQQINAWNQTVAGLLEAKILAGYERPEFIADQVYETQTTRVDGGKMIGVVGLQLPDRETQEDKEFPSVGMEPRWVVAQKTIKYAQKLALTKECVYWDRTGELLSSAESMGYSLGYLKEYLCASVAQGEDIDPGTPGFVDGRSATSYIYKGESTDSANATYQTTAGTGASLKYNFVNKQTNLLTDWKNFQTVQKLLNLMREPETNLPISCPLQSIIVSPNGEYNARAVVHATQVLNTTGASGLSTSGGVGSFAPNPVPNVKILSSNVWNKQLVDSGLSQSDADAYWYAGAFQKCFVWWEAWPLSVTQGNPLSNDAMERDVVNTFYCSWRGVPVVRDPHFVVKNTN